MPHLCLSCVLFQCCFDVVTFLTIRFYWTALKEEQRDPSHAWELFISWPCSVQFSLILIALTLLSVSRENQSVARAVVLSRFKTREKEPNIKRRLIWMHLAQQSNDCAKCGTRRVKISFKAGSTNSCHLHLNTQHPTVQLAELRRRLS